MAVKSYIFIVPCSPVFNTEFVPKFESFSGQDSSFLYSALYENHLEVISEVKTSTEVICCFDENDEPFLQGSFAEKKDSNQFIHTGECWTSIEKVIARRMEHEQANILLLFSNTIGITPCCINQVFNLLNHEDNNIVVGRSANDFVSFIGLNHYNSDLFMELKSCRLQYFDFLSHINRFENYIFTLSSGISIDELQNFRDLYKILSRRESIEFCSHEMHEKFTHLFIEYRELLK